MGGSGGIAKVLVVGNVATGKTSVINRFARNKFSKVGTANISTYQHSFLDVDFCFDPFLLHSHLFTHDVLNCLLHDHLFSLPVYSGSALLSFLS